MPWCPKSKTEYRAGFTVCADCGSKLVEEEPVEEKREPDWEAEEGFPESAEKPEGRTADSGVNLDNALRESLRQENSGLYQDSSERASDNRSSALILLAMGVLGLGAVILGIAGILPIRVGNPYLFYGVMGAVSILFVVAGMVSVRNAKIFAGKAESENSLRSTLLDWCVRNLAAAEIDRNAGCTQGEAQEVLYFRRVSYIREKLNHQFVNLDQGFLDQFIDDYVYNRFFGEEAE